MQLFYCPEIDQGNTSLDSEESRHCSKVLRKKPGDQIQVTNGNGKFFECILVEVTPKKSTFSINSEKTAETNKYSIHIAIAPTKSTDRIEWFVEKAVEIGVQQLSFVETTLSERRHLNLDRLRKKAIAAMKQSVRAQLPKLNELEKLNSFVRNTKTDQLFVAHLEDENTEHLFQAAEPGLPYLVLIGPEGGFTDIEIKMLKNNSYSAVKLGAHRLRTETAGVVACDILNNVNQIR